jgi:uncharacterized protein (DUF1684 family)
MRDAIDELTLADWRRRVAELYVDVRRTIASDPDLALAHWRTERERLYREHPQSPVPRAERTGFRARHFPADPRLRFEVPVEADAGPEPATDPLGLHELPVSAGGSMRFRRIGRVDVPFPAGRRHLAVYWLEGYAGGLFLPFRDATNGRETYGAGRYLLDAAKSADLGGDPAAGTLRLDFNFAYQPSCAFDPRWACPLAPAENWLDIRIEAGEHMS